MELLIILPAVMFIRKSTYEDLPQLMALYRIARSIQLENGNLHQWREGYPSEEVVREDIGKGCSYVIVDGEERCRIVGAFSFIPGKDPTYSVIEGGSWIEDTLPYATIHRLGSMKSVHGIASACFDWCWSQIHNIRIDTHSDNTIMRHCITKAGFRYCGIIHLLNGDPRMAYQKIGITE